MLVAVAASGCVTEYVRLGKPRRFPLPPVGYEEQIVELYPDPQDPEAAACIPPGSPVDVHLNAVEAFGDYIDALRGEL